MDYKTYAWKALIGSALPISTILRDYLKVCDNNREAKLSSI